MASTDHSVQYVCKHCDTKIIDLESEVEFDSEMKCFILEDIDLCKIILKDDYDLYIKDPTGIYHILTCFKCDESIGKFCLIAAKGFEVLQKKYLLDGMKKLSKENLESQTFERENKIKELRNRRKWLDEKIEEDLKIMEEDLEESCNSVHEEENSLLKYCEKDNNVKKELCEKTHRVMIEFLCH